jgi:putative phosphoribosyl transferase
MFQDRYDAGRALASALLTNTNISTEPVVLALPRGGVPVAFEVAARFRAPLDVCIVQRLEVPCSGVAMGAVASERVLVLQRSVIEEFRVPEEDVLRVVKKQLLTLNRREKAYRGERTPTPITGRTVILVDDGLASVAAPMTAIAAIRARMPERLVVATPVACAESYQSLLGLVDDLVCLEVPTPFHGVHHWYRHFPVVSDLDVRRLHAEACHRAQNWLFPH